MKSAVLCFLPMALALANFTEKDNCVRTCGNVSVPFPFGLDNSCARNSKLVLTCSHISGDLSLGENIPLFDIFVENGTMNIGVYRALDCYDETGSRLNSSNPYPSIQVTEDGHYTFSDARNKLTVIGCDTSALISDSAETFGSGCFSLCCEDVDFMAERACSGLGCCQTSIPKSLRSLNISMGSTKNYTTVRNVSSCGSAFVVDQESFDVSDYKLPVPVDIGKYVFSRVVLDWVVERDLTCEEANLIVIVAVILCTVVSGLVLFICKRRAKERYFRKNGGEILKHQRVKIFTEAELAKATNNYDASNKLGEGGFASVYKGKIDSDALVAVKKPRDVPVKKPKDANNDGFLSTHDEFLHEIGIISQVNHKNLVKLLGICLETKVPLLVYEFIPNGTLYHHIHDKRSMFLRSWKNRLKIASEAALALEYLHSLADPPVIHSDVKSLNILLDEKYSAKVSDFGASVLISPGKTRIAERIQGTIGYLDPEYLSTGELTTKSNVYSFGVVLVELLTGEMPTQRAKYGEKINIVRSFISAVENRTLLHMINFEASNEGEVREIEVIGSLIRRCLNYNGMNRPTMRDVAEQLDRINKNLWGDQRNDEETQSLLDETRCDSIWTSISEMNKPESTDLLVFDIEAATTSSSI